MSIGEVFDASIEYYADIFSTALELLPFEPGTSVEVLDLGAGTGLFSKHVLEKYPKANFVLYDLGEKMLEVARKRFKNYSQQFEYVLGDYRKLQGGEEYDLVISSLSIHHLEDREKRELFGSIYTLLRKGGIFINIDQIRGETPYLRDLYWNHWLEQVRAAGFSEERIKESIGRRIPYDKDALLEDQLQWLKSSGFGNVDCVYKNFFVGVFLAIKE
jgi:tRNA (cmo5U34)-methyltransferase